MLVYLFCVGCCFFSFLNVVIDRSQQSLPFIFSRSQCEYCHHPLSLLDMIPILSQLFYHSRCRYCHQHYSWNYLIVEVIGGLSFLYLYNHHDAYSLWWFYYGIYYFELSLSDWKYYNIICSHWFMNSALWIAIGLWLLHYSFHWIAALAFLLIMTLIHPLIKNQMGYGDILLFSTIILPFGIIPSLSILLIACITAIIFFIIRYYQTSLNIPIPFIPFMSIAILIYHLPLLL